MNGFSNRLFPCAASSCAFALALAAGLAAGCGDDGAAGSGGSGGSGGAGGGGSVTCLDASAYADLFTVKDSGFCVVALYDADAINNASPTWGRHGGPVYAKLSAQAGSVDVVRLGPVPEGTSGKLASTTETVDAAIPATAYFVEKAIDLPFFGWTAISYTQNMSTAGELILLDGTTVAARYDANGFYDAIGLGNDTDGRLVYSGLSLLGDAMPATNGVYAAETCGAAGAMPRLLPGGDMTCAAPASVASYMDFYSGPVTADRAGNVFTVPSSTMGQVAYGFAAETIKPGAGAAVGDELFKLPGYAVSLAAIAPDAGGIGVVAFQPSDPMTYVPLDAVARRYRVEAGKIVPEGAPGTLLGLTTPATALQFFTDDQDRLWVTAKRGQGSAVAVLARKP